MSPHGRDLLEAVADPRAALAEGLRSAGRWIRGGGGRLGVGAYLLGVPESGQRTDWREIAPVPRAEERYRPQGLAYVDGALWLTDHHENRRSHLYRIDPATGRVLFEASMPPRARHPGGLAHDGEHLWALDYVSRDLYRIDLEATREEARVVVEQRLPTGLVAPSAIGIATIDGRPWMGVSDYLWRLYTIPPVPDGSGRTYLLPMDRIDELGPASVAELSTLSYDNGGFPQGLEWVDGYLAEAVNNLGLDRIELLDVTDAVRAGDPRAIDRAGSIAGPGRMIEDVATDGQRLWTTDEGTYRLYERDNPLPDALG